VNAFSPTGVFRSEFWALAQCALSEISVLWPATVKEVLHVACPQSARLALSRGGKPMAFCYPVWAGPPAPELVIPASRDPVSHHMFNAVHRLRSGRLRALFAQAFFLLSQLPLALPRNRLLGTLVDGRFTHAVQRSFRVEARAVKGKSHKLLICTQKTCKMPQVALLPLTHVFSRKVDAFLYGVTRCRTAKQVNRGGA
jgi:hypothetical protein